MVRHVLAGLSLIVLFGAFGSADAYACGVGCHATPTGACVRDGWEQGLPVRNECPATSVPRPPCGAFYRFDRRKLACVPRT